jgi:hypothetical protein
MEQVRSEMHLLYVSYNTGNIEGMPFDIGVMLACMLAGALAGS